jgi:hypothetical protein
MTARISTAVCAGAALLGAQAAMAQQAGCIGHRPNYIEDVFEVEYDNGCSGHDEPELDPVSNAPGSARDLTWTVVLPKNGRTSVDAVGPTVWFGGTVTDPNSLFGQAFLELQFYPNGVLSNCGPNGSFFLDYAPGAYSACSPVWKLTSTGRKGVFHETAAFNAMLTDATDASGKTPLVMYEGDTITIHFYVTPAQDGFHVTVTDLTTGGQGTIVLNSKQDGPLMPAFDTQEIGNALGWGLVFDTPNSVVWEIGHTSDFAKPPAEFCVAGETFCDSYDASHWAGFGEPLTIKSVTFGDGSSPKKWAAVSDLGGKAEVEQTCATYGGPFCVYPWYTLGASGWHYGVDYPDTLKDFGQANQFAQTTKCGGPFGANSTYCATILK